MLRALRWLVLGLSGALLGACVEIEPGYCAVGSEDCACTAGGGCDPGLACTDEGRCETAEFPDDDGGETLDTTFDDEQGEDGFDGSSEEASESGDDESTEETGDVDSTDDTSDTGFPEDANVIFISGANYGGNFGGVAAADSQCQQIAEGASLEGTFIAWVSDSTSDAIDRLAGAEGWIRTDGLPAFEDALALAEGRSFYPPTLTESGAIVNPQSSDFWSGTGSDGRAMGSADQRCDDWTSNLPADQGWNGEPGKVGPNWASDDLEGCGSAHRLICVQIDEVAPIPGPPPPAGRLAFVTDGPFAAAAGLESADNLCAAEAAGARLPGSYLAALALDGQSALGRFDLDGPAWFRVDGVRILESGLQPAMTSMLEAPLYLNATGDARLTAVFTGAGEPYQIGNAADTCTDWSVDSTNLENINYGLSDEISWWGGNPSTFGCGSPGAIFCLEE